MKPLSGFDDALLYECYQCSRCTGSCPAAIVVKGFNPRNLLLTCSRMGLESAISDEKLWCCTTCHVCEDRCPQMIEVTDLLRTLMNEAARRGFIPERVKASTEEDEGSSVHASWTANCPWCAELQRCRRRRAVGVSPIPHRSVRPPAPTSAWRFWPRPKTLGERDAGIVLVSGDFLCANEITDIARGGKFLSFKCGVTLAAEPVI